MDKKVEYIRVVVTEQCNLHCDYCHREGSDFKSVASNIKVEDCVKILKIMYSYGVKKVKLMGGEPTLYREIVKLIKEIRYIGNDIDLSMITNGLFNSSLIDECIDAGLDRINISVHAFGSEDSLLTSGMKLDDISLLKSNIMHLKSKNKLSKLNYVYLNGQNPRELFDLINWVASKDIVLDILNYLSYKGKNSNKFIAFDGIEQLLRANYGISSEYMFENIYSLPSKRLILNNGAIINLKVVSLNSKRPFNQCDSCHLREACIEGISAIRLIPGNVIKPCLLRDDNKLKISEKDDVRLEKEVFDYLDCL